MQGRETSSSLSASSVGVASLLRGISTSVARCCLEAGAFASGLLTVAVCHSFRCTWRQRAEVLRKSFAVWSFAALRDERALLCYRCSPQRSFRSLSDLPLQSSISCCPPESLLPCAARGLWTSPSAVPPYKYAPTPLLQKHLCCEEVHGAPDPLTCDSICRARPSSAARRPSPPRVSRALRLCGS